MTKEQSAVVTFIQKAVNEDRDEVVLVPAVAGAGKTYLLQQIVANVPHTAGMYIAYNKAIATEAQQKFPESIKCLTANALAYRAVVRQMKLRVGTFTFRDIKEQVPYERKLRILELLKQFCLSKYLCVEEFAKAEDLSETLVSAVQHYLELMYSGKIECTHDFYMKVFHMGLADGSVTYPKTDFLLLDESGDLNEVILEIFRLLPAKIKVACGDQQQAIYAFNHTVNGFDLLKDEATTFGLTQSFRVSAKIAARVEAFCKKYINPDVKFTGIEPDSTDIVSRAMLSRTNAGLIHAVKDLVDSGTKFKTTRSLKDIFKLPLMISYFKYQGDIRDPEYKHLQADIDKWYETSPETRKHSLLKQLIKDHGQDPALLSALLFVSRVGKSGIINIYNKAEKLVDARSNLTLATAHSAKGLEWDEVVILNDLNSVVSKTLEEKGEELTEDEIQELNLYYVACSRAKLSLINAAMLG